MDNTLDPLSLIDRPTTILDPYDLEAAMLRASLASVRVDIEAAWCGHMVHESSCYRNGRRTNAAGRCLCGTPVAPALAVNRSRRHFSGLS